jgi:hypothetical protein
MTTGSRALYTSAPMNLTPTLHRSWMGFGDVGRTRTPWIEQLRKPNLSAARLIRSCRKRQDRDE